MLYYMVELQSHMIPAGMMLLASIAMATGVVKLAKKKHLHRIYTLLRRYPELIHYV